MTKLHTGLSGLLVLQLLIAAALFWGQQQPGQQSKRQALLSFQAQQLDRVVVSDADHSITLTKSGDTWLLPDLRQLPADAGKLRGLLDKLQSLQTGWPVATTDASQHRFEVAKDKFQRKLQLYQADKLVGELLIGTSPGFRKSHVRRAGDDAVYAVKLNSFDWPAKAEDWLDKALLAASDIKRIEGPDYVLAKQEDGWHFNAEQSAEDQPENTPPALNQEKAKQLASALTNLSVQALADNPPDFDAADSKAVTLQVSGPKGDRRYRLLQNDDKYYVSRDDRKQAFTISQFDYDRIAKVDLSQLTLTKPEKEENPAAKSKVNETKP